MPKQSTNHILLIRPAEFFSNDQTALTNHYQHSSQEKDKDKILQEALIQFDNFEQMLKNNQILITTLEGRIGCPDNIYPNWALTFEDKTMNLFSMMAENRRLEKSELHISLLNKTYRTTIDFSNFEKDSIFLEGTSSMVLDRINKIAYMGVSARSNEELALQWANLNGFELVTFETESHNGEAIYHTDLVMYIGTNLAVVSIDSVKKDYQSKVIKGLSKSRELMEISSEQVQEFCGNCIEIKDIDNNPKLLMSSAAYEAHSVKQKQTLLKYYSDIIHSDLNCIEKYGGGSARCMVMELF